MNRYSHRIIMHALFTCFCIVAFSFYSIAQNSGASSSARRGDSVLLRPETGTIQLSVQLYSFNAVRDSFQNIDGALAQYSSSYSSGVDWMDAVKLTNINEGLGFLRDGVILAIERRALITTNDSLFFYLTGTTVKNYQFHLIGSNWPVATGLVSTFIDTYLNTATPINLAATTVINFSITGNNGSAAHNRFMIVFSQPNGAPVPVTFKAVEANLQDKGTVINWQVENETGIAQYEIESSANGINFSEAGSINATGAGNYQWIDPLVTQGTFYRVVSVDKNGNKIYSTIVAVGRVATSQSVSFVGNNDAGSEFKFSAMPQGLYSVRLLTINGQQLAGKAIFFGGGTSNVTVGFDAAIAKGVGIVEIIGPDKISRSFKVIL